MTSTGRLGLIPLQPESEALTACSNGGGLMKPGQTRDHGLSSLSCPAIFPASLKFEILLMASIVEPVVDPHPPSQSIGTTYYDNANPVVSNEPIVPSANGHAPEAPPGQACDMVERLPNGSNLEQSGNSPNNIRPGPTEVESAPSDSHALAETGVQDGDPVGLAQVSHEEPEVKDLGWTHDDLKPAPLVGGLANDDLWTLIRRFNKQMYHVKAMLHPPPGNLDLNIADEDEFSPDKLRMNLERLYMTVIVGLAAFGKHIARLRSWREPRRTSAFCAAYFLAWILDLLTPLLISVLITLIVYPPARTYLFPPAPLALVDSSTGGVQKPRAGMLGSHDSLTGAPENFKGEAVEQEASNFTTSIASIALTSVTGKHPAAEEVHKDNPSADDRLEKSVPDPGDVVVSTTAMKKKASGDRAHTETHDKTKKPMGDAMWEKTRPAMHILEDIADTWERFANALSPTPPFPKDEARVKLAVVLLPLLYISFKVTGAMVVKGTTFGIGFGFFADPIIWRVATWLNRKFPHWQKFLELRNTLLKGVPTNAQLTITLLRIGENNKAPLPPPPKSGTPPSNTPEHVDPDELPLDATEGEVHAAIHPEPQDLNPVDENNDNNNGKKSHGGKGSKFLSVVKGTAKAGIASVLGADKVKAAAGSVKSRQRLGAVPRPLTAEDIVPRGPVEFPARYKGKKGRVVIVSSAATPCVAFVTGTRTTGGDDVGKPVWSIAVEDVQQLRKVGGLGWKAKLVVGWALDREVVDGLEIVDGLGGKYLLTAMQLRDELFNRLIAMGRQKWEAW